MWKSISSLQNIHNQLKDGRTYVVEIPYHTFTRYNGKRYTAFGKGIYKGEYAKGPGHYYLWDVHVYLRGTSITFHRNDVNYLCALLLNQSDTFYDLEEIKDNAKRARQQMEQRSLNMILKRVVNEEFQW
jgi:hypothetical protein